MIENKTTDRGIPDNKWLFHVAGVQHHRLHKCADELEKGSRLTLIPEPDNRFDPNAIKIVYMNNEGDVFQIGYVPKRLSGIITICVTRPGKITECIVADLDRDAEPWRQCQVLVKGED